MEQFLAILHELSATALANPSTAALTGGGVVLVLVLLMLLGQSGRLRRLRKALELEQQSRAKLHETVDGSEKKLEALGDEIGQYQGRLAQLESDKQNQTSRIEALGDKFNAQQTLNNHLEHRLTQAEALINDQATRFNSQLTQYQAQFDSARQANDTRIAELGRQMEQLQQKLAAQQASLQPLPLPVATVEATPELEQNNVPVKNLDQQPVEAEPSVLQPNTVADAAAITPPPSVMALEPEAPVAKPAAPAATSLAQPKPEPAKATSGKGLFGGFGKKAAAPQQPQASQEKPPAAAAVAEPVKTGAKKSVFGLFGKKTVTPADPPAKPAKPAVIEKAPQPTPAPEPARAAPPLPAEAKPAPSGSQSAPPQPETPARAPKTSEPDKATTTKALMSFMADDLKKGTKQLKGLFRLGGKQ